MKKHSLVAASLLFVIAGTGTIMAGEPPPIFDGKTLDNWTTLEGEPVTKAWEVVDGVIHLDRDKGEGGNIITRHEYGDFDFSFDWKIVPGGNSGIKYRVRKFDKSTLGCEYQILGDTQESGAPKHATGSLYDLYPPNEKKRTKPIGEYNHARIVIRDDTIQHWMNGELLLTATVGDAEWDRRIAESKFSKVEGFGRNRRGKIMLTDHGAEVWYKNLRLVPLPPAKKEKP